MPADIKPVADKMTIEVEPFDPDKMGVGQRRSTATGKRKRVDLDNLDLFETGFQKSGGRKVASTKKRASALNALDNEELFEAQFEEDGRLLTSEIAELERFTIKPSIQAAQPARVRKAALPFIPESAITASRTYYTEGTFRPISRRSIGMSARTISLSTIFLAGREMSADSDVYQAWESKTYPAFKNSSVEWWQDEKAGSGKDKSFRSFRHAEEDRLSYDPNTVSALATSDRRIKATPGSRIKDDIGVISDSEDGLQQATPASLVNVVSDEELPDLPPFESAAKERRKHERKLLDARSDTEEDELLPSLPQLAKQLSSPEPKRATSHSISHQSPAAKQSSLCGSDKKTKTLQMSSVVIEIDDDDDDDGKKNDGAVAMNGSTIGAVR